MPFEFKRFQSPMRLALAMPINKAQRQALHVWIKFASHMGSSMWPRIRQTNNSVLFVYNFQFLERD